MHHIPGYTVSGSNPVIGKYCFVAFYLYAIAGSCHIAIHLCGSYYNAFVFFKAFRCFFHYCESLRQHFTKRFFNFGSYHFFKLIDGVVVSFLFSNIHIGIVLNRIPQLLYLFVFGSNMILDALFKLECFSTQVIMT